MSQKYEQIRVKVAKQYKDTIKSLEIENKELKEKILILENELNELKSELSSKTEWIERMQEFCNMSDEDRKVFLENEKAKQEIQESLNILTHGINNSNFLSDVFKYI